MTPSPAEIEAAMGKFDAIFRTVNSGTADAPEAHCNRMIVDTALTLTRRVRRGELAQDDFDQMLWGLMLMPGADGARFERVLSRVGPELRDELRELWSSACAARPSRMREITDTRPRRTRLN